MAYADTLNALGAALGQDGGASAPAAAPTPPPARGGYGDTLSALAGALGQDAPAPAPRAAGFDTPIPGSAPALPATMGASPPLTVHPSRAVPSEGTTDDAIDTVEGTGERNYATGPAAGGSAMDKIRAAPGAVNDLVRAAANAMPIVGSLADKLDAGTSAMFGGDYGASLKQQQDQDAGFAARNPVAAGAAGFAGAAGGTVGMLPDAALGMVGGLGARLAGGAAGGAALNAADAAVRGENVPVAALEGAAGGAAGPILEGGAKLAAEGVKEVGSKLSPIIAGLQLRGAAPGDIDALLNNARTAQVAATKLRGMSSDPATLNIRLGQAPAADASGAAQTTSSAVGGDMGLYQAEKAARTVDNGPFNAGDSARSAATVGTFQAQAPTGDVFAPGQMIRSRLDALEKQAADAETSLTAQHQDAVTGRAMATDAYAGQQNAALADRTAGRTTDAQGFTADQQAGLVDRTADRNQARFDAKSAQQDAQAAARDNLAQTQAGQRDAALGQAQGAAQAVGPMADPNALGADFRAAQTDAASASKDAYGKLYKAIDPDGTLTTVVSPLKQAKQSIADGIDPYTGVQPVGPEAALWQTIDRLPDVVPFASLQNLDTRATAAMKAVRLNPSDHDPQAISRLTALKGAIKDNIASAGQAQADHEAGLVAAGHMSADDGMEGRLNEQFGVQDPSAVGQSATGSGDASGFSPTGGTPPSARAGGTVDAPAGRLGTASGGQGEAPRVGSGQAGGVDASRFDAPAYDPDANLFRAPQRPDVPRPQSLSDFVRLKGGVQDTSGDLAAMGQQRLIARPGAGMSPDAMREAAAEAGYLGADTAAAVRSTTPNDLTNALENGDRTYSVHDYDAVHAWDQHDQAREAYDQSRGGDPAPRAAGPRAKAPLSSYSADDIYGAGAGPTLEAANGPLNLTPNWDDGAIDRKRAADAAYAEHAQTFKNGIVAPSFKDNGFKGQFQTPPSGILAKAFHPGPTGGAHLDAYLKSAGNDPRALDAVEQFALNGLRAKIGPLGTLKQDDVDRWLTANGPAVKALDAVKPGFLDGVRSAGAANDTLLGMGQAHKAETQSANVEAARQAFLDNEARRVATGQANYQDKTATQALIRERQANAAAANTGDAQQTRGVLAERRSDDAAQDAASLASTRAGIGQARNLVKGAQATPAGVYGDKVGRSISSDEVENAVGNMMKTGTAGATRMRDLVGSVQPDRTAPPSDALQGLQKAGVDWMARNFVSDSTGQVVPHKLISFVKENGDTLKELYTHEQVSMMGALARATEANIKWRTETAVKDGSDTAKKLIAYMKGGAAGKIAEHTSLLLVAGEAISQGFEHGGVKGAALGAGGATLAYLANGLRSLGVRSADDLTRAALADVNVAKLLVGKAPTDANPERAHALLGAMRRSLVLAPAAAMAARQKQNGQRQTSGQ